MTPALANCLVDHAAARGAILPADPLLRYRDGHPLTNRRYDRLWKRLPRIATQGIPTHCYATPPSPGENDTSAGDLVDVVAGHEHARTIRRTAEQGFRAG